ncbi:MAG: hypothetical protein RB191_10165 [Terriglobia bacterium]|nr:hypothetical protein [Terriglobia bacterium]
MTIWTVLRIVGIGFAVLIILGLIGEVFKYVFTMLNDKQNSPEKAILTAPLNFIKKSLPSSVVSENGVTVAYQRALTISILEDDDKTFIQKTDERIREILRANPSADFHQLASSLDIVVSSVQRGTPAHTDRLMTVFDTTIMYRFTTAKGGAAIAEAILELQKQVTEILLANPAADLYRYEDALGIAILNIQRKKELPTTKGFNG